MELVKTYSSKNIISESLKTALTYKEYTQLINDLVAIEASSGINATPDLVAYTKLNQKRMARWDKTVKISEDIQQRINAFNGKVTWLVLTESWCGDAAHVLPFMNKIAELNPNINLQLVFRDEHPELMDQFLTNGAKSIPKLIMIDNLKNEVVNTFGPRPTIATEMVENFKATHGKLTDEFKAELQAWYNRDKGENTIADLIDLLGV
ncbi:thioredoxin family protein [Paucihalobacter sp.]|uniref:thioredoxin family protein n=1 Tax=Paucihalobacter sp. TaxID=2850405 RepID=UPI002FE3D717